MFDNKTKSIIDAVNKVLGVNEDIDPNKRTKDTLKGANEPTKQKDDVGPGSDGKSTKVKYRPGPLPTSEGFKDRLFKSLDEANEEMLSRYMKSRGYNPETTTKDKKIAITKSNEFKKWLNDHQFEEAQYDSEEYSEEQLDEMINEVLSKSASAGDWIHDFVHSKNAKFKGKSTAQRKKQALAAYYAQQKEEVELEEGKRPETGNDVPWVDDKGETGPEVVTDKSGGKHTPMSRAKHLARIALKKVKKEVVGEEAGLEEGAFSSGALKLTPQGKKKFADLHKSIKSTSTVRDKDEKGTYTSVRVKNAGESDYKETSRKYDKE